MAQDTHKKILEKIIALCDDVAFGRNVNSDILYKYTVKGKTPDEISRLAEAFGLMLVKLDIREEHGRRLIEELTAKNIELESLKAHIEGQNFKLMEIVQADNNTKAIIGQSYGIKNTLKFATAVAKRPVNTLLLGETGTGKEKFAKFIHFNSKRYKGPFVAVNCSAIPDALFESEMFGIEKGVATGVMQKKGLFEEAHGGTLFLDEIADLPLAHQAKLLRALEEQEITRVGSAKPIPVDIKIISAANANLEEAVAQKKFRMDLFYRLNVAEIHIPPLRERGEDILMLASHFLKNHCLQMKHQNLVLQPEAKQALMQYAWPGNVRELNNEMERVVVLAVGNTVGIHDLSPKITKDILLKTADFNASTSIEAEQVDTSYSIQQTTFNLFDMEKQCVHAALEQTKGNKSKAAELLGITREGLRKKLNRMGIE